MTGDNPGIYWDDTSRSYFWVTEAAFTRLSRPHVKPPGEDSGQGFMTDDSDTFSLPVEFLA